MKTVYENERGIIAGIDGTWEQCNCLGQPSTKGKSEQIRVGPFLLRAHSPVVGHAHVDVVPAPFGIMNKCLFSGKTRFMTSAKRSALMALREMLVKTIMDIDTELKR